MTVTASALAGCKAHSSAAQPPPSSHSPVGSSAGTPPAPVASSSPTPVSSARERIAAGQRIATGERVADVRAVGKQPPADVPATTVIDAATPARLSMSVSRILFASAPVVVTASVTDPAGIASGAHEAELLGVPLLLTHHDDAVAAGATPTAQVLTDELTRLGATSVLAEGASAAEVTADDPGVQVVTTADDAHGVAVPNAGAPTVLVQNGPGPGSVVAAAAAATAHAAGDIVVGFRGADPRADVNAIAALAKNPPTAVLAVGGAFGSPDQLAARIAVASTGTMLPGGGQRFFPDGDWWRSTATPVAPGSACSAHKICRAASRAPSSWPRPISR